MMQMMYGTYGMWEFWNTFMMVISLALFVYWAVNSAVKNALKSGDVLDILKTRYAKNEITAEEYKKIKDDLSR